MDAVCLEPSRTIARRNRSHPRMRPERLLDRISKFVGERPDKLAVTVAARTGDPFAVLVSTVLSLRARDEVTHVVTKVLLSKASTPFALASLTQEEVVHLIHQTSFRNTKARHLVGIAKDLLEKHDGRVPDTMDGLLSLKGVGRKSANLVLNLAFEKGGVCVDTHVLRVVNRLGVIKARTPGEAEVLLEKVLPRLWHIPVNGVLIAFGRTQCLPVRPKCSTCPVRKWCPKEGILMGSTPE